MLYKTLYNVVGIPSHHIPTMTNSSKRGHSQRFQQLQAHLDVYLHSFFLQLLKCGTVYQLLLFSQLYKAGWFLEIGKILELYLGIDKHGCMYMGKQGVMPLYIPMHTLVHTCVPSLFNFTSEC